MEKRPLQPHPFQIYPRKIKEEGVVVFDDVTGLPPDADPFISPNYVISIGHRGSHQILYDGIPDVSTKQRVAVIFPDHSLSTVSKSDDYLCTLLVVDSSVLNDPMLQIIHQMRYRYESHPCVQLDRREYKMIMNVVAGMRETARLKIPEWRMLMLRQLEFLLRFLSYYRSTKLEENHTDKRVSLQFHNDLAKHFREHRDVGFYAEKACLSLKYFSYVIKQETGYTPGHWIRTQTVAEAKRMLHTRKDLTIQTIADMLGFEELAAFSRYFHRETGVSPREFRKSKL
ncbi:MAG: helix-turn-helix domain-containing protein [Bacteroidales bacterium]|nr:helix-turn-helix domain-containing protein [Bacteroidales bacterium]